MKLRRDVERNAAVSISRELYERIVVYFNQLDQIFQ